MAPPNTQPKLSDIHKQFRDFVAREDVKTGLDATIRHKRAGLLKRSFFDETGLTISINYVYLILNNRLPETEPVTIGEHTYEVLPA